MLECPLCHGRRLLHQRTHVWVDANCSDCGLLLQRTIVPGEPATGARGGRVSASPASR